MSRVKWQDVKERVGIMRLRGPEIYCAVDSPGDGITRFKFDVHPIFAYHEQDGIAVVLGAKQAMLWLDGYGGGYQQAKKEE